MADSKIAKTCSIENCGKKCFARKLCAMHYNRWRRHGDPLTVRQIQGNNEMRFWSFVQKTSECWIWNGYRNIHGYGQLYIDGKLQLTHRYSYWLANGHYPHPVGRHICDTPACVRPDHIVEGTQADNMNDMVQRQRSATGENHSMARLTTKDVRNIKQLLNKGILQKVIAVEFNVSRGTISDIATERCWKNV